MYELTTGDTVDAEIVSAEYVITDKMISLVTDRIEWLMNVNTASPKRTVKIDYREFAQFFGCPEGVMKVILKRIYDNPPARLKRGQNITRVMQ